METYISKNKRKIWPGGKLLPVLILTLIIVGGYLSPARAQSKANQSDWNVPPPIPPPLHPGTTTKAGSNGKVTADKSVVLSVSDIPPVALPVGPPVQMPVLAAITTTPPPVNAPRQPTIPGTDAGLTEIPPPNVPDAPPLPTQSVNDAPVTTIPDLPIPESPELPAQPAQPISSGQATGTPGIIPVMPEVLSQPSPSIPAGAGADAWFIPSIPENTNLKLTGPTGTKATKTGGKGPKKVKPHTVKK
ncbi:hypothetical protein [Mucilaginibacter sp. FT3.2]|uniref:hypothetical protein n=1 Tax=Mucilaginibacter sp. FT3.2 TaxID=2723090 RepID=UPI001616BC32|nr:hypothetical protein [Mucilaginibacter sp. FT3.2]MBB6231924.1 hypothetical protein [Mucilaginibacter sp. FT3.2]